MERNANYALVGFASLMLFIGLVIFVVWLARVQFARQYDTYDVVFVGPVNGLSQGGEVHFNGIKVGEITTIGLDKDDPKKVVARVRVTSDVPIRADSYASAEPQGITGVSFIQITPGSLSRPLLKNMPHTGEYPVLNSRPSAISDLLSGGGTVLAATVEALNRVNRVLSDDNIQKFDSALGSVQAVTAEAARRKQLFADADRAVTNINDAAESIKKLSDSTDGMMDTDGRRLLHNAADAAEQVKAAAAQARGLVTKLEGPTSNFASTGLPELTAAVASLRQAADTLNRISNQIEQSPQSLIAKAPPKEVQVRP